MSDLQILHGGVDVAVQLRDEGKEIIKVRELPIRLIQRWGELCGDEPARVELMCDQAAGWADKLTVASYEEVLRIGDDLNRPIFDRWMERSQAAIGRMLEGAEKMSGLNGKALALAASVSGSALPSATPQPRS